MAPPDHGSGASPPAAAALRRQASCTAGTSSRIDRDEPAAPQLERRLSCSSVSFSSSPAALPAPSSASTTYHPAACSAKSSCESLPFADAELGKHPSISSTASSYASGGSFNLDDHYVCSNKYLDFEPPPSTRAPAVQAMTAAECSWSAAPSYDPKRLPSSMVRTRSTNPVEWSVASNESLFSIRLSSSADLGDLYFDAAGFPRLPSMSSSDTSSVRMMRLPSVSEGGLCLREDCTRCSGAVRKSVRFAATAESVYGGGSPAYVWSPPPIYDFVYRHACQAIFNWLRVPVIILKCKVSQGLQRRAGVGDKDDDAGEDSGGVVPVRVLLAVVADHVVAAMLPVELPLL